MHKKLLKIAFILVLAHLVNNLAFSRSSGVTRQTQTGCTCHNSTPSSSTTLTAQSSTGAFRTRTGQTLNLSISVINNLMQAAGIDIAVVNQNGQNAGTLSPETNSGLQASDGELTHNTPKTMQNGTASFNFTWTAPTTGGNYTLRAVGNAVNNNGNSSGDAWNYLSSVTITVFDLTVTAPNGGETWCSGSSRNITWTGASIQNINIYYSSNGGQSWNLLASNVPESLKTYIWNIPNDLQPGSLYKIKIEDANDPAIFDESNSTFSITSPPTITQDPSPLTLCEGENLTLRVTATGEGLSYQWRKNGILIPNATNSTYSQPATNESSGIYDCVVSNSCGSVTSQSAEVIVNLVPKITTHPVSIEVCEGESATFSVEATGTEIRFQWRKNGSPIPGATSQNYTIPAVQLSDSGSYDVIVLGTCNPPATSQQALLKVLAKPKITQQPAPATVLVGSSVTFSLSVTGTPPLYYQWRKDGNAIVGANSNMFTIDSVQETDAGYYDCIVSNICDTLTSQLVQLQVTLRKAPILTLNMNNIDFGSIEVSDTVIKTLVGVIQNTGNDTLIVNRIDITGKDASDFAIVGENSPFSLAPEGKQTLQIRFRPSHSGEHIGSVQFICNAENPPNLHLKGKGVFPILIVDKTSIDFGLLDINSTAVDTVKLYNPGPLAIQLQNIAIQPQLEEIGVQYVSTKIDSGGSLPVVVSFTPTEPKQYLAEMIIYYVGKFNSDTVTFKVSGFGQPPAEIEENTFEVNLNILPNPSTDEIIISFQNSTPGLVTVELINNIGQVIGSWIENFYFSGKQQFKISTSQLSQGTYKIQLVFPDGRIITDKFIIIR